MLRLARINSKFGKEANYAKYLARNAERAAKRARAKRTLELSSKQAVNKSELQAEVDAETAFNIASECLLVAEQAIDLAFRTDTYLDVARSRLSLIKGDAARG